MPEQFMRDGRSILWWEVREVEHHLHNRERWFGLAASPSATNAGDAASLNPYVAISGDGVYGADADDEAFVLGADDTPAQTGMINFDAHRLLITAFSSNTPFMCRLICGTGTMAAAITAGTYSEFAAMKPFATGASQGGPIEVLDVRVDSGTKVWLQCKNATDNATISFLFGIHEYDF